MRALEVLNERGMCSAELEDSAGRVCAYGALRVALGYSNHLPETDPEFDNWPWDNYENADYVLKRNIPEGFKKKVPFYMSHTLLWAYNDKSTEETIKALFQRSIDSMENAND